jgi:serine protease DegS
MKTSTLAFVAKSAVAGLAIAFVVLALNSHWRTKPAEITVVEAPINELRAAAADTGPLSYAHAVGRAAPAVVNIYTAKMLTRQTGTLLDDPFFRRFFAPDYAPETYRAQNSLGSGVIVSPQGYVLTNNHVVKGADEIQVALTDGRTYNARVVGTDPDTDLAVLALDETQLPFITLAASDDLQVGDVVLAIGNPFGVGQTVTQGIVSATGRSQLGISTFENFIQTDAAINPGNSGGALINTLGDLIGINTAIFSQSGGSHGIGFAIPISLAKKVMEDLIRFQRVIRGFLGVQGRDLTPALANSLGLNTAQGALVTAILRNGPAAQAGILPGDVITYIEGHKITQAHEILDVVAGYPPNSQITVEGLHRGQAQTWTATVAERPANAR